MEITLTRHAHDLVVLPQKTKAGYAIAKEGDGVYTNRVQWKRGVVRKGMIPTLKTSCSDVGAVVRDPHRAPFFEISPMASDFFDKIRPSVTTFLPPAFGNSSRCTASSQQPKSMKTPMRDFAVF